MSDEKKIIVPEWSWSPCDKPTWNFFTPAPYENEEKRLTVVMWDALYREGYIDLALKCCQNQYNSEDVDFIWIEWTDKPNPIVLKYDFLDVYCMNLEKNRSQYPAYDTGIQWNLGLYLARTDWVTYQHCDIMGREQCARIIKFIDEQRSSDRNEIWVEGFQNNHEGIRKAAHRLEFEYLLASLGKNFDSLAVAYRGAYYTDSRQSQGLHTVNKNRLIEETDGWFWNCWEKSERWEGPGHPQERLGDISQKQHLIDKGLAVKPKFMEHFAIPHNTEWLRGIEGREEGVSAENLIHTPGSAPYEVSNPWKQEWEKYLEVWKVFTKFNGGMKHYSDFVRDWIPQHEITLYKKSNRD